MTNYRDRLGDQLRAAAQEHLASAHGRLTVIDSGAQPPRPRRRRFVVGGFIAAGILTPAALAASGVLGGETQKGEFPDRSTFTVLTVPDPRGGDSACERVEFREADGKPTGATTSCPVPHGKPGPSPSLSVGFVAAPASTVLLRGTVPDGTASVHVPSAISAVQFDRDSFRFAAQIPRNAPMLVIAKSADGRDLDRFERSAMEP